MQTFPKGSLKCLAYFQVPYCCAGCETLSFMEFLLQLHFYPMNLALIRSTACFAAAAFFAGYSSFANATEVIRYKLPDPSFPISAAVEVPAGAGTIYVSGKVPPLVNSAKPNTDPEAFGGDTEGQTVAVLRDLEAQLKEMQLTMADVVKMQVFLVADPAKGSRMDFAGFMRGYRQFFGTPNQPNLPARSVFQAAGLANPAWYVEIEVVAVRAGKR
ncbi:RidA family protein [Pantoea sp. 18069]|uniref:RidA family protein n=1 Tax=Pantoea sp. 18069 TaxID=2681415 RepID=UPI001F29ED65|nr:RidA family protein [Pantoea sp. 18069]